MKKLFLALLLVSVLLSCGKECCPPVAPVTPPLVVPPPPPPPQLAKFQVNGLHITVEAKCKKACNAAAAESAIRTAVRVLEKGSK